VGQVEGSGNFSHINYYHCSLCRARNDQKGTGTALSLAPPRCTKSPTAFEPFLDSGNIVPMRGSNKHNTGTGMRGKGRRTRRYSAHYDMRREKPEKRWLTVRFSLPPFTTPSAEPPSADPRRPLLPCSSTLPPLSVSRPLLKDSDGFKRLCAFPPRGGVFFKGESTRNVTVPDRAVFSSRWCCEERRR
jgi:hypothetical protein